MRTSDAINEIAAALSAAQGVIKNPPCNQLVKVQHKSGGSHSYRYATLPAVFDTVREALSKNGIAHFTAQAPIEGGGILISCRLVHTSGQWIESSMPLAYQPDPKLMAGHLTYYRRYLFNGLVGIAGDDDLDDDTNSRKDVLENPGDYVMQTGKAFKGKKIRECGVNELTDFAHWIDSECREPSPMLLEDREAIVRFLLLPAKQEEKK